MKPEFLWLQNIKISAEIREMPSVEGGKEKIESKLL